MLFIGGLLFLWSCKGTKTTPQKIENHQNTNTQTFIQKKFVPTDDKLIYEQPQVIKKIQTILYLNNYATGRVNGEMNAETLRALAAFQANHNIRVGDRSSATLNALGVNRMDFDIATLQEILERKGYEVGVIDGILGPKTRTAYQTFLHRNKLQGLAFSEEIKVELMKEVPKKEVAVEPVKTSERPSNSFVPEKKADTPPLPSTAVQQVQEALRRQGYNPGLVDGIFSPQTQDALFKYQVDKKLPIGGFNDDTLQSLGL